MTNTIPTIAEQVALATEAHARIGNHVDIDGRQFRVVRFHYDVRFLERNARHGVGSDAHVACLRRDLARAGTLPGGFQDRELAAKCERIVAAALAAT